MSASREGRSKFFASHSSTDSSPRKSGSHGGMMSSSEQWLSDGEQNCDDTNHCSASVASAGFNADNANANDGSPQKRPREIGQVNVKKPKIAKHDDQDSDFENDVRVNGKNLSPLKGQYAAQYAKSVTSVTSKVMEDMRQRITPTIANQAGNRKMDATELKNLVVKKTQQPLAKQHALEFEKIRQFIEDFLNVPENLHATIKAYHHKMNHFIAEEKRKVTKLDEEHKLLVDRMRKGSARKSIEDISNRIDEILLDKEDAENKIAVIERKQAAGSEPLCVSFVVVHDQVGNRDIIIIGISSPEKNPELEVCFRRFVSERVNALAMASSSASSAASATGVSASSSGSVLTAFSTATQRDVFVVADPASLDYQKFMQQVADRVGATHPSDPLKECAEKSYFSLLTKLYELRGDKLDIKMICNFAFLPKLKLDAKPRDKDIEVMIKTDAYIMSLIEPCQDCDKNMTVNALLLYGAASGQVNTSPVKPKTKASISVARSYMAPHALLFTSGDSVERDMVEEQLGDLAMSPSSEYIY